MSGQSIGDLFARVGFVVDSSSVARVDSTIGRVKAALGALVAFQGFRAIDGMVSKIANAADDAVDTADKLGITVEAVQELDYAAKASGTSLDGMKMALGVMAKATQEARGKGGAFADQLFAIGITAKQVKAASWDINTGLEAVADKFAAMPAGAERTATAIKLFGKSGADMIPFLKDGAAGIAALRKEANELGVVIDGETAVSLKALSEDRDRVGAAFEGIKNQIVIGLLPAFREITAGALAWLKVNRKAFSDAAVKVIRGMVSAIKGVAKAIWALAPVFSWILNHWKLLTIGIIAFKAASISAAVASGIAWAIANAPLILMAALIAAVVLVVEDLYVAFTGGKSVIGDFANSIVDGLGNSVVGDVFRRIKDAIQAIVDVAKKAVDTVKQLFSLVFDVRETKMNKQDATKLTGLADSLKNRRLKVEESLKLGVGGLQQRLDAVAGRPAVALPSGTGINAPITNNITVNAAPGDKVSDVARTFKAASNDAATDAARMIQHAAGAGGVR